MAEAVDRFESRVAYLRRERGWGRAERKAKWVHSTMSLQPRHTSQTVERLHVILIFHPFTRELERWQLPHKLHNVRLVVVLMM